MRIVVTGASGFVGSHTVASLIAQGNEVWAVVRAGSTTDMIDSRASLRIYDGTTEGLYRIVHEAAPDAVVHVASRFVVLHQPSDIDALIEGNLKFGCQLLDAMARCGVRRLVNFGTSWQHYETDGYRPVSLYAATKQAFEALAAYYADAHDMAVLTLKLSDTYGPDDRRGKLVALLLRAARTGETLELSPGEQLINMAHVFDVVEAVRIALTRTAIMPAGLESFAVRGAENLTLRSFVGQVERSAGARLDIRWGARPYRAREVMQPWLGETLPGWMPRISLEAGLRSLSATQNV